MFSDPNIQGAIAQFSSNLELMKSNLTLKVEQLRDDLFSNLDKLSEKIGDKFANYDALHSSYSKRFEDLENNQSELREKIDDKCTYIESVFSEVDVTLEEFVKNFDEIYGRLNELESKKESNIVNLPVKTSSSISWIKVTDKNNSDFVEGKYYLIMLPRRHVVIVRYFKNEFVDFYNNDHIWYYSPEYYFEIPGPING